MNASEELGLKRLRERTLALLELLEEPEGRPEGTPPSTPKIVIAGEVNMIWNAAWLYCPDSMKIRVTDEHVKELRVKAGFCECGERLPQIPDADYPKLCERCASKLRGDVKAADEAQRRENEAN